MIKVLKRGSMIEIKHLQKVVGAHTLLDIDTLIVRPGEIVGVIGTGEGGKRELFNLLLGRSRPTSGSIQIDGLDPVHDQAKLSAKVGVMFPEIGLYENRTALANLAFYCDVWKLPAYRAREVLAEVGLADHADVPAGKLSQSLARRLAFGRAILHKPCALLLYNPFAGSDSPSAVLLGRLMQEKANKGMAVLILAADTNGLNPICNEIYHLESGSLLRSDPQPDEHHSDLSFKVPARLEGQVVLVNLAEILYASAEEGQTTLHTTSGQVPSHLTLTELEGRLAHNGFFRAHRAYLVNLQHIKSIIPYTRDSYTLVLDDANKTEIPLSKTSARELKDLLGY